MSTIFRRAVVKAQNKLERFTWNGEGGDKSRVTLDNLNKTFTDANVTNLFRGLASSPNIGTHRDLVARGIHNCSLYLPDEDMHRLLSFLEKEPVTQNVLNCPHPSFSRSVAASLSKIQKRITEIETSGASRIGTLFKREKNHRAPNNGRL